MRRDLLRSLALHAALLAGLLLAVRAGYERRPRLGAGPLRIEVLPEGAQGEASRLQRKPPSAEKARPRLEALAPAPPRGGPDPRAGETVNRESLAESGGSEKTGTGSGRAGQVGDGFDVAGAMSVEEETKAYPFLDALLRRVDPLIGYPRDFVRERVQGKVTAHFNVDRTGRFQGDFLRVSADEPILEAYVLALLVHAFREPLPERSWGEQGTTLVTTVEFKVLPGFSSDDLSRGSRFKNILTLHRSSVSEPLLNEEIEKLFARYLPPIIPLPGGPFLDFIRAYELIAGIGSETERPEERRRRRTELNRAKWEQVVRGGKRAADPPVSTTTQPVSHN